VVDRRKEEENEFICGRELSGQTLAVKQEENKKDCIRSRLSPHILSFGAYEKIENLWRTIDSKQQVVQLSEETR
jgi:hypothetical protein